MIAAEKKKNMDIGSLCTDKSHTQGSIPGTLEDPNKGSGIHPVGYGHWEKKRGSNGYQETVSF